MTEEIKTELNSELIKWKEKQKKAVYTAAHERSPESARKLALVHCGQLKRRPAHNKVSNKNLTLFHYSLTLPDE